MMEHPSIIVVGAGLAGICAAIRLQMAGFHDIRVIEKANSIGGTWRDNIYPGAACDIPSHLYSYSFAPKDDWTQTYATQPEIQAYLEGCIDKFEIRRLIRLNTEVVSTHYDAAEKRWAVELRDGETLSANFLIMACGQLHRPHMPEIAGVSDFVGATMHSAAWKPDVSIEGRKVALIGNAASGIQIAGAISDSVNHLTIFQRSPNWITPRLGGRYSRFQTWLFKRLPPLRHLRRGAQFLQHEMLIFAFRENSLTAKLLTFIAKKFMRRKIGRDDLVDALTPEYPIGCKRILISNGFLKLFRRDDVALETEAIDRFDKTGIVLKDGRRHEIDVAIFATGFKATELLAPIDVVGEEGAYLSDAWEQGPQAHLGITVPGFPNMFLLYGPNTGLGHNSMVFMIECQVRYICRLLREVVSRGAGDVAVRPEILNAFNARLQERASNTAWAAACGSWYKNEHGRLVGIWPFSATRYWWMTRRPKPEEFILR